MKIVIQTDNGTVAWRKIAKLDWYEDQVQVTDDRGFKGKVDRDSIVRVEEDEEAST